MRMIKINWLGPCPKCQKHKLTVCTQSERNDYLNEEDLVTCDGCGKEGVILCTHDEHAYVDWNQEPNGDRSRLLKQLNQEIHKTAMVGAREALVRAYNRCGSYDSVHLGNALRLVDILLEMKEKGIEL